MTNGLLKSINTKHGLYRNFWSILIRQRKSKNRWIIVLRIAKTDCYSSVIAKFKGDTKEMCTEINNVLGNKKKKKYHLPCIIKKT